LVKGLSAGEKCTLFPREASLSPANIPFPHDGRTVACVRGSVEICLGMETVLMV
jgi:hypothetical protein